MMQAAMRSNPFYPPWYAAFLSYDFFGVKEFEKAIAAATDAGTLSGPGWFVPYAVIAASFAQLGQQEEAEAQAALALQRNPKLRFDNFPPGVNVMVEASAKLWKEGLRKAGFPEGTQPAN